MNESLNKWFDTSLYSQCQCYIKVLCTSELYFPSILSFPSSHSFPFNSSSPDISSLIHLLTCLYLHRSPAHRLILYPLTPALMGCSHAWIHKSWESVGCCHSEWVAGLTPCAPPPSCPRSAWQTQKSPAARQGGVRRLRRSRSDSQWHSSWFQWKRKLRVIYCYIMQRNF